MAFRSLLRLNNKIPWIGQRIQPISTTSSVGVKESMYHSMMKFSENNSLLLLILWTFWLCLIFTFILVLVEQKNKVLEISAEHKPSPREGVLIKELQSSEKIFCPKCTLGLDIKHTDVLILKQYLREDGTMLPKRITGLCAVQQKNIGTMVLMARRAGWFTFLLRFL